MLKKVACPGENHIGGEAMSDIFLPQNLSAEKNSLGDIIFFCDTTHTNAGTLRIKFDIFCDFIVTVLINDPVFQLAIGRIATFYPAL